LICFCIEPTEISLKQRQTENNEIKHTLPSSLIDPFLLNVYDGFFSYDYDASFDP
jgi:hypothetical protein